MGLIKKIQRYFKDPRRSPVRKPINQQKPVPVVNTQTTTTNTSFREPQKPVTERDEIARRMKEMVTRSTELRDAKNLRSSQHLGTYEERVNSRLGRVPTKNQRSNTRNL